MLIKEFLKNVKSVHISITSKNSAETLYFRFENNKIIVTNSNARSVHLNLVDNDMDVNIESMAQLYQAGVAAIRDAENYEKDRQ